MQDANEWNEEAMKEIVLKSCTENIPLGLLNILPGVETDGWRN